MNIDPTDPDALQEPGENDMFWIDSVAEPLTGAQVGGGVLVNVHSPALCAGRHCVMHNPSDHHMRQWPTNWRADRGLMERVCTHGIGHPDPDALAYCVSIGQAWQARHGCDGCCAPVAAPQQRTL